MSLVLLVGVSLAQVSSTQEFSETYSLSSGKAVFLRNGYGNVHVTAWDQPNVKLDAIKRADSSAQLSSAEVVVKEQTHELCIATRYPAAPVGNVKTWFGFTVDLCRDPQNLHAVENVALPTVDYTLFVPRNMPVVVLNDNGDVDIEGTREYVLVDIRKGHLTARDIAGNCNLFGSYSGVNITLTTLDRDTHIHSAVGPMIVNLAPTISARVRAHAPRSVDNDFGWQSRPHEELQATLADGKVLLDVMTGGGSIEFRKLQPPAATTGTSKMRRPAKPQK